MFKLFSSRREKNPNTTNKVVEDLSTAQANSNGRVDTSDFPATNTTAGKCKGKTWLCKLFGQPVNTQKHPGKAVKDESEQRSDPQQSKDTFSHDPATTTTARNLKKAKKRRWKSKVFPCCESKHQVTPLSSSKGEENLQSRTRTSQTPGRSPVKALDKTYTPYAVDEVVEFKAPAKEDESAAEKSTDITNEDKLPIAATSEVVGLTLTELHQPNIPGQVDQTPEKKNRPRKDKTRKVSWAPTTQDGPSTPWAVSRTSPKQDLSPQGNKTPLMKTQTEDLHDVAAMDEDQDWLGFPNAAHNCYMISTLQSLLTLTDFIRDISSQEELLTFVPEAELIRRFMDIVHNHRSTDINYKLKMLDLFKDTLSLVAPEFENYGQKDAHEFLITILEQIRELSPLLQQIAFSLGKTYRCPINDHMVFRMQRTRTCKSCGAQSTHEEDYTNLSLNLMLGGLVEDMLQDYLMETELDCRCECGGNTSGQQFTFVTLPRVLILHLKRFHYSPFLQILKKTDPIYILKELTLASLQDIGVYKLVSIISHLGSGGDHGHYVSDGVHPDAEPNDTTDRWLDYNDTAVTETSGAFICGRRQRSAYILFYQRQI